VSILVENFKNYIMKYLFVFLLLGLTSIVNAQTAEQPDCGIRGLIPVTYYFGGNKYPTIIVPANYSGVAYHCSGCKVSKLYNYSNGKRTGLTRKWDNNGQLIYEYNCSSSSVNGVFKTWYTNGHLAREENFSGGHSLGPFKVWYENGQRHIEANTVTIHPGSTDFGCNGHNLGTYHYDLQLLQEGYQPGFVPGTCSIWNFIRVYNGLYKEWNENGQLYLETNYKDGHKDGLFKEWNEDGQLNLKANYKDGELEGVFKKFWTSNGKVHIEAIYLGGKLDGWYYKYYEDGDVKTSGIYEDGVKIGIWRYYYDTDYNKGQKSKKEVYSEPGDGVLKYGILTSEKCWDFDGNVIECD
jgi:antitoxin component YwqK of YwqJK toxin-antitoxin module